MANRRQRTGWQRVMLAVALAYGLALKLVLAPGLLAGSASAGVICHTDGGGNPAPNNAALLCDQCCLMRAAAFAAPLPAVAEAELVTPPRHARTVVYRAWPAPRGPPAEAWSAVHTPRGPPLRA